MNISIQNAHNVINYQPLQQSTGNLLQYKYYKNTSYGGQKENKTFYNRAWILWIPQIIFNNLFL